MLLVFVQQRVTPPTSRVLEGRRVVIQGISFDPVVNALSGYSEHAGDVSNGATVVVLQDGEGPPIQAGIPRLRKLTPKPPPLPRSQVEPAHGLLLHYSSCS
jgi:hypothetical protein